MVTQLKERNSTVQLADGRLVGWASHGAHDGSPFMALHGMPGSRLMYASLAAAASRQGIHLVALDRPGFGHSDPHKGGTLLGYADDVAAVADRLGFERFGIIGASGGGHYALACAARLGPRVTRAVVVSGIGPLRTPGSLAGMASANRMVFRIARLSPALAGVILARSIGHSMPSMEAHVHAGTSPSPDIAPETFAIVVADQKEAIRQGGAGVAFDARNLWRPWGFDLSTITTRVDLWHGAADDLAPVALARLVAAGLPNCRATFFEGEGHIDPLTRHGDQILATAADDAENLPA